MISHAVRQLLERFEPALPDLHSITVFLPDNGACHQFRKTLLRQLPKSCQQAVIPPWVGTLSMWLNEYIQLPDTTLTVISEQTRRIMLIEALQQHPSLFKQENKWQVTLALLKLFDELNLHNACVSESADEWLETVQRAYGIEQKHEHLQQEASLVHTLWHAWHEQLHANKLLDSSSATIAKLRVAVKQLPENFYCYAITTEQLTPGEKDFIQSLVNNNQCCVIEDELVAHTFIKQAFAYQDSSIKERVADYKADSNANPIPFSLFFAKDAEFEARAVDAQIRQWLISGKQHIGVISEDRKLSRRLRALLERADIPLQDMSGWSLSTTSAAAVLERWLECIEEDFDHRPMLDFLKSHFLSEVDFRERHLENIYRLEKDIIQYENVGRGLFRYQEHLQRHHNKLDHWPNDAYQEISQLLEHLNQCASPLIKLYHAKFPCSLKQFIDALLTSLTELGIVQAFQQDSAGIKIIQTLEDMRRSLIHSSPKLEWDDFRTWLGLSLEEQLFSPHATASPVQLMTLEQARLKKFDALIIAAADNQHMPGSAESSPFFNQASREALGLDTWKIKREQRLQLFQQTLCAAPEVLVTCKAEENGEAVPLSPWIEVLNNFHKLCFDTSLDNKQLHNLLTQHDGVFICDTDVLPKPAEQPSTILPTSLFPERISASSHQRLINCPYQFFSADALKLKPSDEINEELKKINYGERIHLILQAFHQQVKNLPAPFTEAITTINRQTAVDHLSRLSEQIFKKDLEDNALHRSWQHRWLNHIPAYIDWQILQQQEWTVKETELWLETRLSDTNETTIFGRLDRMDANENQHAIIDYKTGASARQQDVDSGEDVQLATYALLDEDARQVAYLSLDISDGAVKTGASLGDEALTTIKLAVKQRLETMLDMTNEGQKLTAWGDTGVCSFCDFTGLCRRQNW